MRFIYNLGIFLYRFAIRFASIFNPKANQWLVGQNNVFSLLEKQDFNHPYWFHCASVGEFEQGLPLMMKLKNHQSNSSFIFTFFSPSGYEYVRKRHKDLQVFYLPFDKASHAKKFIEIVQPKSAFFIKYEFWFYYLSELKKNQIPTFLVSGIFRQNQPFFKWYGQIHRAMLNSFTFLFIQNEESEKLLHSIGITNTKVMGDTRFDRVMELKESAFNDNPIHTFIHHSKVFIAGSVWASDVASLKRIIQLLPITWKIIIAPHEIEHYSTSWLNEDFCKYSSFANQQARILILDTLGVLSKCYRVADLAYIGGGFGKGIHNILEAAIYQIPILIGPRYQKFNEAVELIQLGVAFNMEEKETESTIIRLLSDHLFYESIKHRSNVYMSTNTNVSEKIRVYLDEFKWLD